MSQTRVEILWQRQDQPFVDNRYSRRHLWRFDGGAEVAASSSPAVVPLPWSDASAVDPEEAFVAALASCHMLWFLSLAAKRGLRVDSYRDDAVADLAKNPAGKLFVAVVTLRPEVKFSGERLPDREEIDQLHHLAHEECFIAHSVKSEVRCEPI